MADQLPQFLIKSFTIANQPQNAIDKSAFYGPYMRLLYYLFGGIDGDFEVQPEVSLPYKARETTDTVATLTVEYRRHPVMFVQVKPSETVINDLERKEADDQLRVQFLDVMDRAVTPRIPGVIAFGTRLAFYEYVPATRKLTPPWIPEDPTYLNDVAPIERWNYDVLEAPGFARLRHETQSVIEMCQALN
ncbi:hypothetical protein D9613_008327 [Agrocybe pediades]|uniref:Uncharacterized protein n=1 Tax=Agrocybe pediades TaxID=84607 RepID=A0A8H4QTX2_9AGAR|nr:hypothetical protein D9613_008327 [Agrocybe pediades]